jgi:hypothetical protein
LERAVALFEILESRLSLMHTFSKVLSHANILKQNPYCDFYIANYTRTLTFENLENLCQTVVGVFPAP